MAKTKQNVLWMCLILVLGTFSCYWSIRTHGWVNIDDHDYIYQNKHVTTGLSWDNIQWAFTTGHASNWHPLTWISHMIDCQLFGVNPGPQHLVNLFFHIADTVLLFLWLVQMTGSAGRSFFVAAFFAWHPLHVESVAWASERKDVLSTLFWLLTLMAYVGYVRKPDKGRYYLTLLLFALGLMSKPMVVTLPCVLLLLDYWPLGRGQRTDGGGQRAEYPQGAVRPSTIDHRLSTFWSLFIEKLPFFALTVFASIITYLAQQDATTSLEVLPVKTRAVNAAIAYLEYLSKTFWPVNLAAMYPYVKHPPILLVVAAVLVVVLVTVVAFAQGKRRPYLLVGWLWFLGTLVPAIGLVQVGSQAMADRYMYIPSIGLFIAVVWLLAEWAAPVPAGTKAALCLGAVALFYCFGLTCEQLQTWKNGETLFRHAVEVTKDNYIAYDSLAGAVDEQGRHAEALQDYYKAVAIEPKYPEAQYNLGTMLKDLGRLDEAAEHLQAAIDDNPKFSAAYLNLGSVYMKQGNAAGAQGAFLHALELDKNNPMAFFNMGTLFLAEGRLDDAVTAFNQAILLKPDYEDAHGNLGVTLMRVGQPKEGMVHLEEAVRLSPTNSLAHFNLGLAELGQTNLDEAVKEFNVSLELKPGQSIVYTKLALAFERSHKPAEAVLSYRQALQLQPDNAEALNGLAWLLATEPDAKFRSGTEAVELATKACGLAEDKRPDFVLTLAAAYAEAGRFSDAIAAAQKGIDLAESGKLDDLAEKGRGMLKGFQAGLPYRVP